MANETSPEALAADVGKIITVWKAHSEFTLKDVTLKQVEDTVTELRTLVDQIRDANSALTNLENTLESKEVWLREIVTRGRSGIRGVFGPDSTEYEQAGGKRRSERKRPTRKPKADK